MNNEKSHYLLILSIFEKYGFETYPAGEPRTIIIKPSDSISLPFSDLEAILLYESIAQYIYDVEPVAISFWKLKII